MTLRPMRRIAEVATDIGGTNIDFRLLEERYKLAERECALEGKLKCIENGVYAVRLRFILVWEKQMDANEG